MNTQWIKISDQPPVFPAWVARANVVAAAPVHRLADCAGYTHWQPANPPAPPPRELTQREKDDQAYRHWVNTLVTYVDHPDVWHAALAKEREELPDAIMDAANKEWGGGSGEPCELETFIRDFFRARREGGSK